MSSRNIYTPNACLTIEQEHTLDKILGNDIEMSASIKGLKINLKTLFSMLKNCFIQYNVSTKNGTERNGWALSWPIFFDKGELYHTQNEIKQVFDEELSYQKYQQTSISNDVYRKFRNTKHFFDFSVNKQALIDCDSFKLVSS